MFLIEANGDLCFTLNSINCEPKEFLIAKSVDFDTSTTVVYVREVSHMPDYLPQMVASASPRFCSLVLTILQIVKTEFFFSLTRDVVLITAIMISNLKQ